MSQFPDLPTTAGARVARPSQRASVAPSIGPWQLVSRIGQGRLTRLYRARPQDCPPDRPADYVIKVPHAAGDEAPLAIALLKREAAVACRVSHPHLISVLDARVSQPPYYVAMPYLDGAPLSATIAAHGPISPPQALWIARQVAEALVTLHADGWRHGDVKPSNIYVSPVGHATLLDLGFAARAGGHGGAVDEPFLGTLQYTAPETMCSNVRSDARSDIYSLGVTLYEALTGRLPFHERDTARLAAAHLREVPPDARAFVPQLSQRVARLLAWMLAKEPLRRPFSAAELANLLAELEIETFQQRAFV